MSAGHGRRSGFSLIAGARTRRLPFDAHEGTRLDQLRRYEQAARIAARGDRNDKASFAARIFSWMADPLNLMLAIEHIRSEGPKAPGPNGIRIEELGQDECCQAARELSRALTAHQYCQGPVRRIAIPKTSGTGFRTLQLLNAEDKIVHRAITQAVSPFVDSQFDDDSFGFRPGRGREDALIELERLARSGTVAAVITEDLANAFDNVPVRRQLDIVLRYGILQDVQRSMAGCVDGHRRGIPQGSPLSPLLLNIYADYLLDRRWRRRWEGTAMLRSADDLLAVFEAPEQATTAYPRLAELVRDMGMSLKGTPETAIWRADRGFDWLGFRLTVLGERLIVSISERSWTRLGVHLAECHVHPVSSLRAWETVLAWVSQLGPCLPHVNVQRVYARVVEMAQAQGFTEVPDAGLFLGHWERAHARFLALRSVKPRHAEAFGSGEGSAQRHPMTRLGPDRGGPFAGPPRSTFIAQGPTAILHTDGSCLSPRGCGGWAFILESSDGCCLQTRAGAAAHTTNIEMELRAVLEGIRQLLEPARIRVVTDSRYVVQGAEALERRQQTGWRRNDGGLIAHAELWIDLLELLEPHQVEFQWVPGHSGHLRNEQCDHMARVAAISAASDPHV